MNDVKVLIVEDDEWLAEQYCRVLKKDGYTTLSVLHSLGAIQEIDGFNPDVILLDVLLTGGTAFALMHELQSYSDTSKIPIILCTNLAKDLSIGELRSYGVVKIIDKTTMAPSDLSAAIRGVL